MTYHTPLSPEEYEAIKSLPPDKRSERDFERLIDAIETCRAHIEFQNRVIRRHRKAIRAVLAVARDGLCFGDGIDFPKQTGIVWDDSDEYL